MGTSFGIFGCNHYIRYKLEKRGNFVCKLCCSEFAPHIGESWGEIKVFITTTNNFIFVLQIPG